MSDVITYSIELAVGLGCLAAVPGAWRRLRGRWVSALLAIAGLAAVIHAIVALAI